MGVCGTSEAERTRAAEAEAEAEAAAQALAESEIQLEIETDDSQQQGSTATAYGLETAGELLKRLAPQLELPERLWMELSLVFSDETVLHDCVLQEAAIREGATVMVLGVKKIRDHEARKLIRTDADIKAAVKAWCGEWVWDYGQNKPVCKVRGDPVRAEREYGHISQWDTEQVTSMKYLFHRMAEFNEDISRWKVHNVRSMRSMFRWARRFNQDLSQWDVGNVETMMQMFLHARSFNQDLSGWDVRKAKSMGDMFDGTDSLEKRPSWYKE